MFSVLPINILYKGDLFKFTYDNPTAELFSESDIRYPDQPFVKWNKVFNGGMVHDNIKTQNNSNLKVAIIGNGASSLSILYELTKLNEKIDNKIEINHYRYDSEIFENSDIYAESGLFVGLDTNKPFIQNKWGRIFSYESASGNSHEIGCMRFPSSAVLTWCYMTIAFDDKKTEQLTIFPNAGKKPTQFIFRDINLFFSIGEDGKFFCVKKKDESEDEHKKNECIFEKILYVTGEIIKYINNIYNSLLSSLKKINDNIDKLHEFNLDWFKFKETYDIPIIEVVRKAVKEMDKKYKNKEDIEVNIDWNDEYIVELFGRYGFGTGGFRPLNNVSFIEIVRLCMWEYSNEYLIPGDNGQSESKNSNFANNLYNKSKNKLEENNNYIMIEQKVLFVGMKNKKILVISYDKGDINGVKKEEFDYVFLAVNHHSAQKILEPFSNTNCLRKCKEKLELYFEIKKKIIKLDIDEPIYDPLFCDFDDCEKTERIKIHSGLKNLHIMRSTKYFTTIEEKDYIKKAPELEIGKNIVYPEIIISDTDAAATYIIDGKNNTKNVLVSYTWGDEASNNSFLLCGLTKTAGSNENKILDIKYAEIYNKILVKSGYENENMWLSKILAENKTKKGNGFMWDWTRDRDSRGGFKLDWVSEKNYSDAFYNHYKYLYNKKDEKQDVKQRFFLAGDSFSHLGGWLEGAFITSINAVAGFIVNEYGEEALSEEGKKLML